MAVIRFGGVGEWSSELVGYGWLAIVSTGGCSSAHLQFSPASSELSHLEHLLGHLLCHGDEGVPLLQKLVSQLL